MKTATRVSRTFRSAAYLTCGAMALLVGTAAAQSAAENQFDIDAGALGAALDLYIDQSGEQVLYSSDHVAGVSTEGVQGLLPNDKALKALLSGSKLRVRQDPSGAVLITASVDETAQRPSAQRRPFRVAQAASSPSLTGGPVDRENGSGRETIIVTATKRETRLQDTPQSIFVLNSEDIGRKSLVRMGDYLSTIPGVSQQDFGAGFSQIIIRGLSAGPGEAATAGVYFGEAPLPSIAELDGAVDLRLVDIDRVEVLRGPQGTLYGSGSLGGTIRYIPNAPNLIDVEGSLNVGYSNTAENGGDNFQMSGALNIPIVKDQLALRVAAYRFDDSGYVNVVSASDPTKSGTAALFGAEVVDEEGVGDLETTGVRASLLWTPTDNLEFTAMYARQDVEQDGFQEVNLALGGYQDTPFGLNGEFGGREFQTDDVELFHLVGELDLGWASVLSASTWFEGSKDFVRDIGRLLLAPAAQDIVYQKEGFTQEVRLTSQFDGPLQFTTGVYFEDLERDTISSVNWAASLATLPIAVPGATDPEGLLVSDLNWQVDQIAVFGEVSYDLTDQLTATLGGRWFDYTRAEDSSRDGPVAGGFSSRAAETSEQGTTFKANLAYKVTEDALVYAEWSQGFRIGAPGFAAPAATCDVDNDGILDGTTAPNTSEPLDSDNTDNYELGGKVSFLDGRVAVNAAVFNVEWDGIPVAVVSPCGFAVTRNAGEARTRGVEMDAGVLVTPSLRADFGFSYINAELTRDDDVLGPEGTRLPGSPEFNANFGLEYEFELAGRPAFARSDYAYVGGYRNDIAATFPEAGDYGRWNMRVGASLTEHVSLEVFASNITNEDAITFVDFSPVRGYRLVPRTIGVELGGRF